MRSTGLRAEIKICLITAQEQLSYNHQKHTVEINTSTNCRICGDEE